MKNNKKAQLTTRVIGAACGAIGFIVIGIGIPKNQLVGAILIGVGGVLIAIGS